MTKTRKIALAILCFIVGIVIALLALLIQRTIIMQSLEIDYYSDNQIAVTYNGSTEVYNMPR